MNAQFDVINQYFSLVESLTIDPAAFAAVLHPELEQIEFPNAVYRSTQYRSFDDVMNQVRMGRELLRNTSFEVHHTHTNADGSVLVEGLWQAIAVNDVAGLTRGQQMIAHVCMIFEFKEDRIYRQRRYTCYQME